MMHRIGVVGAGAIGLSTAVNIQDRLPNVVVTIIADQLGSDTTTAGVGGLAKPTSDHMGGTSDHTLKRWFVDSFREFDRLSKEAKAGEYGIYPVTGYQFSQTPLDPLYKDIIYNFKELTPQEIQKLSPMNYNTRYGYIITTLFTEGSRYQSYLAQRFKDKGGVFKQQRINSMDELIGQYDVIANCSGLGARTLVGDMKVYPRRGHLVKVHAPWVKQFVYAANDTYIFPLSDCVALGSVSQKDNYSMDMDMDDAHAIIERCCKVMPSLQNARVLSHWVGLRPHRDPVRLEKEIMTFGSRALKVVHNYGHGRYGVCLSWGAGVDAAQKVIEFVNNISTTPKL